MDEVASLLADDIAVWHNYDRAEQTKDETLAVLGMLCSVSTERRYEDVRRETIPGGFVQQHHLRGTTTAGASFEVAICMVVQVDEGQVRRIDEYFDPAQTAPHFAG